MKIFRHSPHDKLVANILNYLNLSESDVPKEVFQEIPKKWQKYDDMIIIAYSFKSIFWQPAVLEKEFWQMVANTLGGNRIAISTKIQNDGYRTPCVEVKYGADSNGEAVVKHKENGIIYSWDITSIMFSKGNATEKHRVGTFNCVGETIVDLFAGIGYFTLPYLVKSKAAHVIACEWNEKAIKFLKQNLDLNDIDSSRYTILLGDNRDTCPVGQANRVNLGLIPSSADSWATACRALSPCTGGWLHIHENVESHNDWDDDSHHSDKFSFTCNKTKCKTSWCIWANKARDSIASLLSSVSQSTSWTVTIKHIQHVKQYGPHVDHLVLDLYCSPEGL